MTNCLASCVKPGDYPEDVLEEGREVGLRSPSHCGRTCQMPLEDVRTLVERAVATWRKMSEDGRCAALALDLPAAVRTLVERAVATR